MVELKDGTVLKPVGDMRSMIILKSLVLSDELFMVKFLIGFFLGLVVGGVIGIGVLGWFA
jgi:hypothetical protein